MDLESLSSAIEAHYQETSAVFASAQAKTGLTCPPSCGRCFLHPDIRVAPLEMLPMALEIWRAGQAEVMLARLATAGPVCIAFRPGPQEGQGSCAQYQHRPFICRAFGVAAVQGKHGPVASLCATLKTQAKAEIIDAAPLPLSSVWYAKLASLHPELISGQININDALRECLQRILTIKYFAD